MRLLESVYLDGKKLDSEGLSQRGRWEDEAHSAPHPFSVVIMYDLVISSRYQWLAISPDASLGSEAMCT